MHDEFLTLSKQRKFILWQSSWVYILQGSQGLLPKKQILDPAVFRTFIPSLTATTIWAYAALGSTPPSGGPGNENSLHLFPINPLPQYPPPSPPTGLIHRPPPWSVAIFYCWGIWTALFSVPLVGPRLRWSHGEYFPFSKSTPI